MAKVSRHITELHNKFVRGTITDTERQELYAFYRDHFGDNKIPDSYLETFLLTSHPDYGKPDKDGKITTI